MNEVGGVVVGGVGVMGGSVAGGVVIAVVVVVGTESSVVDVVDSDAGAVVVVTSTWRLRDFGPGAECPLIVHPVFAVREVASLGIAAHAPMA